ncbi:MAG TPA: bifunctional UDP-sugar hydrolase/5'-nucleotidase [Myxococcales bacterium]|nr:bifunctional UDP-sugar hydrolase/5'-nucleotidase [Myxococcales bacterium]
MRRLAAALAVLLSCAEAQKPPAKPPPPLGHKLTVIGINDTHGALLEAPAPKWLQSLTGEPIGGAEWFAGWMTAVRADAAAKGSQVVILDAGDEFQGTLISNQFRGKSVTDVYNAVGVTASALGNHEFDFGIPVLKERIAQAHYPVLAANVFLTGTKNRPDWLKPSVLIDVGGIKVGIIGLATVETPLTTNPANLVGLTFVPGGPECATEADALRAQGATVVLVTAHAGPFPPDNEIQKIATACKGRADAIVSGHHHTAIGPPPMVVEGIPIVQSGSKLQNFSIIELGLDDAGHVKEIAVNDGTTPKPGGPQALLHSQAAPLTGRVPKGMAQASLDEPTNWRGQKIEPDEKVAAILKEYDVQVKKLRDSRIGETAVDLRKGGRDDLLANLTADALRSGAGGGLKADFAFQNSGGLRVQEIAKGPITFGQIFDLIPFDNEQYVLTLTAQQVRDSLEAVLHAGKGPLRVSGMRYLLDWEKYSGLAKETKNLPWGALITKVTDSDGKLVCETKSCTATSCEATCSETKYRVAVTDFLANGGDGLTMLKGAPKEVGSVLARDIIVSFIKEHQPLTPELLGSMSTGAQPRWSQIGAARRAQTGE